MGLSRSCAAPPRRIGAYPVGSRGIDTTALAERLEADAAAVQDGTLVPGPEATADPPAV